ncbi:YhgE/Pip family protein [Psychrobacillus sp. NPDC058041]|uniref:YhgE/Pip domain-containing protein n=1 Tax=Psychrobacillus sp. NPDC058041 TaxID=3346310 RepID=UPI0036D803A2
MSIFRTDLQNICRNWVAAILIGGLVFLPSLYAWLNIYASWDPYSHTDQLPVAIVNEDTGATVRGEKLNVGNELVNTLRGNHDMKWSFTSRKIAIEKVEYGDYFAVLIIPSNFSEKLASVVSDNPEKANIEYYVNEKINSIAPKITEKGASVIVEKVSSQFISTVNGIIFTLFNNLGIEIEKDLPDIRKFESYVLEVQKNLPHIHELLTSAQNDVASSQTIINTAQSFMPQVEEVTAEGIKTIESSLTILSKAQERLNSLAPVIENDLEKIAKIAKNTNEFLQAVKTVKPNFTELDNVRKELDDKMVISIQTINSIEEDLNWLNSINHPETQTSIPKKQQEKLTDAISKTADLKAFLKEMQTNTGALNELITTKEQLPPNTLPNLQEIAKNTSIQLDAFINEFKKTIEPTILLEINDARNTLLNAKGLLTNIQATLPQVELILGNTDAHLKDGNKTLNYVISQYPYISDEVNKLAERIRKVQGETDINEIVRLLRNNPEAERSFFEEPIVLNEKKLFPIANYGTGMTPFYTVLAIWVGCLLLISLLATDVNQKVISEREMYFGRLLTFSAIGILQALIVTVGDIVLLGVVIKNPYWFVLFGFLISFVFMSIVYTLVSVFGDVGKAFAIVMLVLQIAGSGGTYPVVLLPKFFQLINPFLPFTYAVSLMREAVGGMVAQRVIQDILFLLLTGIVFILFGIFLKEKVNRKTRDLLNKSRESGLFH